MNRATNGFRCTCSKLPKTTPTSERLELVALMPIFTQIRGERENKAELHLEHKVGLQHSSQDFILAVFLYLSFAFSDRSVLSKQFKVGTDMQVHLDNKNFWSLNAGSGVFTLCKVKAPAWLRLKIFLRLMETVFLPGLSRLGHHQGSSHFSSLMWQGPGEWMRFNQAACT